MANYEDLGFVPSKPKQPAAEDYSKFGFVAKKEGYGEPGVAGMGTLPPEQQEGDFLTRFKKNYGKPVLTPERPDEGWSTKAARASQPQSIDAATQLGQMGGGAVAFGQGFTAGHLPQIGAALSSAVSRGGGNAYVTQRDKLTKDLKELMAKNPNALGMQLLGSAASSAFIPGLAGRNAVFAAEIAAAKEAGDVAKAASLASKLKWGNLGLSAGGNAAQGLLQNPGDVEGEVNPLQMGDRLTNAGIGLGTGALAPLIPAALIAGKDKLKSLAEMSAFKSLGPYAKASIDAITKGKARLMGRTILDENVLGNGILPKSYEAIANKTDELANLRGQELQTMIEDLTAKGGDIAKADRKAIADRARAELISGHSDLPGVKANNEYFNKVIDEFEAGNNKALNLMEVEAKKRAAAKEINWARKVGDDRPEAERANLALHQELKNEGENLAEQTAQNIGGEEQKAAFKNLKNSYGNLTEASDIALNRHAKNFANRMLAPSDYGVGLVGGMVGSSFGNSPEERLKHMVLGASAGLGHKALRSLGPQYLARGANTLSKNVGSLGELLARNPWALPRLELERERESK